MIVTVVVLAVLLVAGAAAAFYFLRPGAASSTYPESYVITEPPEGMHLLDLNGDSCDKIGFVPVDQFVESMGLESNPGYADVTELTKDSEGPLPKRAYVAIVVSDDCSAMGMSMAAEMESAAKVDELLERPDGPCEDSPDVKVLRKGNILVVAGLIFGADADAKTAFASGLDRIAKETGATEAC